MTDDLAPYAQTMGITAEHDDKGELVLVMPFRSRVRGRPGFVHGGALSGLLEMAAYRSLMEALGPQDSARIKPVNVTVSFMRGAGEQTTYAKATIERLGKRVANIESVAWQDDPTKPVAVAQLNVMLNR